MKAKTTKSLKHSAKPSKIDGLSPRDIEQIRKAIRQVWSWSHPRRLALKRAIGADGFYRCEECGERVPKVLVDHTVEVGDVDGGFIARLFCPSTGLKCMCRECHGEKTYLERRFKKAVG